MGANVHRMNLVNMQDCAVQNFGHGNCIGHACKGIFGTTIEACLVGKHAQGNLHLWVILLQLQECEIVEILTNAADSFACSTV